MSWSDVRTGIKTKMESISGVEKVNDFVIWSDDWPTLLSYHVVDGRVNTWQIGLFGMPPIEYDSNTQQWTYNVQLYGLYSIETAMETSKTFEDLCMDVIYGFSSSLNPIEVSGVRMPSMPQLVSIENSIYMQSPVHSAIIQLSFEENIQRVFGCKG